MADRNFTVNLKVMRICINLAPNIEKLFCCTTELLNLSSSVDLFLTAAILFRNSRINAGVSDDANGGSVPFS